MPLACQVCPPCMWMQKPDRFGEMVTAQVLASLHALGLLDLPTMHADAEARPDLERG